ncbi:MAG: hypothetical protein UT32_C0028G0011 [Parcubacteria group bacterium GW2011_GWC2_39_14]|nr:MAG: hypothetical protein UT32_C0028G0011 [Parcubacteria group bacterium GW2011_GWC2_39_14]KKR53507.1 MAG: hypothetical protein UT91_C0026G0011 [Parcubacteria group bacterium GW2011_GWA2_40_23]
MNRLSVYVIEESLAAEWLRSVLVRDLGDFVEVTVGHSASDLLRLFRERSAPDAIFIQRVIDYGAEVLQEYPAFDFNDESREYAGSSILRLIDDHLDLHHMHVVLINDGLGYAEAKADKATKYLRERGLLAAEYQKPFDVTQLITDFCVRFSLTNPYPPLSDWAPEDSIIVEDCP